MADPFGPVPEVRFGPDGTLYVLWTKDWPAATLATFDARGRSLPGWPITIEADFLDYAVGPGGSVVIRRGIPEDPQHGSARGAPHRATILTVVGRDGHVLPGWPVEVPGDTTEPAVGADGTVYYGTQAGLAYARDVAGRVRPGWPVEVEVTPSWGYGPRTIVLRPDGTLYVEGSSQVTALAPDGRIVPGWPVAVPKGTAVFNCSTGECGVRPWGEGLFFGPDRTLYLVTPRVEPSGVIAEIAAIDRQGEAVLGWPQRIRVGGSQEGVVNAFGVTSDGRLFMLGMRCFDSVQYTLLVFDGAG